MHWDDIQIMHGTNNQRKRFYSLMCGINAESA